MYQVTAVGTEVGDPGLVHLTPPCSPPSPLSLSNRLKAARLQGVQVRVARTTRTCQARSSQRHCLDDSEQEDGLEEYLTVAAESQGVSLEAGSSLPKVSLAPSDRCVGKKKDCHTYLKITFTAQEMLGKY